MKGSDKILLLIVGAVVVLIVAAFAFVLLRPEPEYLPENMPDGVAHNYLLALRRGDYERAYAYITDETNIENLDDFTNSVENHWAFDLGSNIALSVEDTTTSGEDSARVKVRKTRTYNDLFGGSQYSDTFTMHLKKVGAEWKITDSNDYWDYCWDKESDCR